MVGTGRAAVPPVIFDCFVEVDDRHECASEEQKSSQRSSSDQFQRVTIPRPTDIPNIVVDLPRAGRRA